MYNYPISIIKKKLSQEDAKPTILDTDTGDMIIITKAKSSKFKAFMSTSIFVVIAFAVFYFSILSPVLQTKKDMKAVDFLVSGMSIDNTRAISKLESMGTVVYKEEDAGVISLLVSLDKDEPLPALKQAMKLSNLEEVSTDGRTVSVVFVSE